VCTHADAELSRKIEWRLRHGAPEMMEEVTNLGGCPFAAPGRDSTSQFRWRGWLAGTILQ